MPLINYPKTGNTEESDEDNETAETNSTGQSISVGIMFTLSWLVIYNIWKHQDTERDEFERKRRKRAMMNYLFDLRN